MAHRLAPEVETELDDVWSDSIEIADRVIDSITDRFFLLATWPHIGRRRDGDLRPGLRSFPVGAYVIVYRFHLFRFPTVTFSDRCCVHINTDI
jgi:plasmid stabilization system protein ParE